MDLPLTRIHCPGRLTDGHKSGCVQLRLRDHGWVADGQFEDDSLRQEFMSVADGPAVSGEGGIDSETSSEWWDRAAT